jgi:Polyketide cyclase / dehydrase and lipid transport
VRTAYARGTVPLQPAEALELWTNVERWPTFIEGFARVVECSPGWPAEGERLSWESVEGGRGRVTEKVVERSADSFSTMVFESALMGRQTLRVVPHTTGAEVELALEYTLVKYGALSVVADALFIRRALRDSLARTVARFAVEAEEEAGLR